MLDSLSIRAADDVCRKFFGVPPSRLSATDLVQLRQILHDAYLPAMAEVAMRTRFSVEPGLRRQFEQLLIDIISMPAELVPEKIRERAEGIVAEFGRK